MKRYIELKENATATHLRVEIYYTLGGINYATYRQEPRGYYLSVVPVTRENRYGCTMESFTAFTGVKQILKEVSRRSAKAEAQAEENAQNYIHDLVNYVCSKNGFSVPEEFICPEVL